MFFKMRKGQRSSEGIKRDEKWALNGQLLFCSYSGALNVFDKWKNQGIKKSKESGGSSQKEWRKKKVTKISENSLSRFVKKKKKKTV